MPPPQFDPDHPPSTQSQILGAIICIIILAALFGGCVLLVNATEVDDGDGPPNPCSVDIESDECGDFLDWMDDNPQ